MLVDVTIIFSDESRQQHTTNDFVDILTHVKLVPSLKVDFANLSILSTNKKMFAFRC